MKGQPSRSKVVLANCTNSKKLLFIIRKEQLGNEKMKNPLFRLNFLFIL